MTSLAVTVVGHDRPGIVAEVTGAIAELGGNLEDSSMSLLRGHFAMTLIASLADTEPESLAARLDHLTADGLFVSVIVMPAESFGEPGQEAVLSIHGADRPGIVHAATSVIAAHRGNVTDLSTRLGRDMYVLTADVTFPPDAVLSDAAEALELALAPLGVHASLRPSDPELL